MGKKDEATKDEMVEESATPTLEEGRAMFDVRKDLDSVLTTEGTLYRDGRLDA